jgi:D-alanine-D-alanine ligase
VNGHGKTRVAVLFGGRSAEHGVSCSSGASVVQHLSRERYEVTPVRIDTDGVWTAGRDEPTTGALDTVALLRMTRDPVGPRPAVLDSMWAALRRLRETVDVVFPVLHGRYGEDGTLQSTLELFGVPYVGNGVLSSAAGMDKEVTKKLLTGAGLTVADRVVLDQSDDGIRPADRERLGLPVFVKPARGGSSIGVSKVDDWTWLDDAVTLARKADTKVLVEAAVPGREVDVGVLEYPDGRVVAGPPLEIRVSGPHAFFDFDAKYFNKQTVFDIPADLPVGVKALLQAQAVEAFHVLGCSGLLRVDFFLPTADVIEHAVPVVNEVNTMPGLTAMSQYPRMWAATGMDYPALLDVLIDTALARQTSGPARRRHGNPPALTGLATDAAVRREAG